MTRAEYEERRSAFAYAMQKAAEAFPEGSVEREAFGSLAWGRYMHEPSASDNKERVILGLGYLEGFRDALLRFARHAGYERLDREMCAVPHVADKRRTR